MWPATDCSEVSGHHAFPPMTHAAIGFQTLPPGILRCCPRPSRLLPFVVRIIIGDVRQLVARCRNLIFQPAKFRDCSEESLERVGVVERKLSGACRQRSYLPESNQRLCAKSLDRGDGRCVDSVRQWFHFLVDRRKRIVCFAGARALATI